MYSLRMQLWWIQWVMETNQTTTSTLLTQSGGPGGSSAKRSRWSNSSISCEKTATKLKRIRFTSSGMKIWYSSQKRPWWGSLGTSWNLKTWLVPMQRGELIKLSQWVRKPRSLTTSKLQQANLTPMETSILHSCANMCRTSSLKWSITLVTLRSVTWIRLASMSSTATLPKTWPSITSSGLTAKAHLRKCARKATKQRPFTRTIQASAMICSVLTTWQMF